MLVSKSDWYKSRCLEHFPKAGLRLIWPSSIFGIDMIFSILPWPVLKLLYTAAIEIY